MSNPADPPDEPSRLRQLLRRIYGRASVASHIPSISHEASAALGSLNSLADVNLRCVDRIRSVLASAVTLDEVRGNRQLERALALLEENSRTSQAASARALNLLLNLRALTRSTQEQEEAAVRVSDLLEQTLFLFRDEFTSGVELVRDFGEVPPVRCRPVGLKLAFLYLLEAALSSVSSAAVLTLRLYGGAGWVHVEFSDNGIPLDPERRARLASGNGRLGDAVETGLVLAGEMVAEQGGVLELGSPDAGSPRFAVRLPADQS